MNMSSRRKFTKNRKEKIEKKRTVHVDNLTKNIKLGYHTTVWKSTIKRDHAQKISWNQLVIASLVNTLIWRKKCWLFQKKKRNRFYISTFHNIHTKVWKFRKFSANLMFLSNLPWNQLIMWKSLIKRQNFSVKSTL